MKKLISCAFIIVIFTIFFSYRKFHTDKKNHLDCRASVTFFKGDEKLKIYVIHNFYSGKGVISMTGVLYSKNKKFYLSQTTGFDYIEVNNIFYMESNKISKSPHATLSNELEKEWLPSFFLNENQTIILKGIPLSDNKWFFSSETTPLYLCERY